MELLLSEVSQFPVGLLIVLKFLLTIAMPIGLFFGIVGLIRGLKEWKEYGEKAGKGMVVNGVWFLLGGIGCWALATVLMLGIEAQSPSVVIDKAITALWLIPISVGVLVLTIIAILIVMGIIVLAEETIRYYKRQHQKAELRAFEKAT